MSYVIRNIHPSVIHIPDVGLRLDSGQTAIVETLSPQMQELLANRALEAISSDPDPPVATVPVEEDSVVAEVTPVTEESTPDEVISMASDVTAVDSTAPVVPEKKTRKASATTTPEQPDGTQ
jgi:hypothetical protein